MDRFRFNSTTARRREYGLSKPQFFNVELALNLVYPEHTQSLQIILHVDRLAARYGCSVSV
jgi:hypothetical protein